MLFILLPQCEEGGGVSEHNLFLSYRAPEVGKMIVKAQEGLSLGCVLQLSCFPREAVLLCLHGSVVVEMPPDSELEGVCMVPAPSSSMAWLAKPCSAARERTGSVLTCETPNYGVSAAHGVPYEGVCATVAPVSRWQQLGSLESGHTLPGQSQLLGDPHVTGVCVWNSHSWTFIPVAGDGNRVSLLGLSVDVWLC